MEKNIINKIKNIKTFFIKYVSGQFKKTEVDSSSINEKNIITTKKCFNIVSNLFKKRNKQNKKTVMCKFNDFGIIAVIFGTLLLFFTKFFHRPLRKIKYYRHKIITKNIISNKVIEIELIKKDKSDINRKIRIDKIEFCFRGLDKNNDEFCDNLLIERIDDNELVFEKNDDIGSYKIKIPFEFSLKYFDAKEIKLTVSYKTPLDDDFIIHDRLIDLTEITNNFKLLVDRQIEIINYKSPLSSEERFKMFNQELTAKESDEIFAEDETREDIYSINENEDWLNNKGETYDEYEKRKLDETENK